jgi:predicted RND superfamily exporter protein
MKKFSEFVIKFRVIFILLTLALTLLFVYSMKNLKINPDLVSYLPESDEAVKLSKYIGNKYGGNLTAVIAIESDDVFKPEVLTEIYALTESLKYVDGVSYVTSLANIIDIKGGEEGIEIGKLIDGNTIPRTTEESENLKRYVLSKDIYKNIVSRDGRVALILCKLMEGVDKIKVARDIKKVVESSNIKSKVYYGGLPFQMIDMNDLILNDLNTLTPLVAFVILVVLFLSFRSLKGVILPFLSVGLSTVWTLGLMAILNVPLTIISNSIPVILTAVGSAYGIHVINKYREDSWLINPVERSVTTLSEVGLAVVLAGVTTIAGFISFIFGSYLIMIREFGVFSALGVLFALVVSITFIPSVLSFFNVGKTDKVDKVKVSKKWANFVVNLISRLRYPIIAFNLVLILVSIVGVIKINREVNILDYFKPEAQIRKTEEMLKKNFGGSLPLYVVVKGDIQDPNVLKKMKEVENFLESFGDVHNPLSIVDVIEEMNFVMGEGRDVPDTREKVSNLIFLIEGEEIFSQLVSSEKDEAIIQANVTYVNSNRISEIVNGLENYFGKINGFDFSVKQTGMPLIYKHLDDAIIKSQIQSLILALIFVFVIISFQLSSIIGGLLGIVPVSLTILVVYGFMGYAGIPLDIATVLIASVSIGMGIDYAIHFFNRLKMELKEGVSIEQGLSRVLGTTGVAILINALSVSLGFLVLVFSSVVPLQRFGVMILLTMVLSAGATLVLLPAIILTFKPRFLVKSLEIKLKEEVVQ